MVKMMLAVVRIKGKQNIKKELERTMQLLKLYRKNHCAILPAKKEILGMIKKIERYVTWGEIEPKMIKKIIEKRGRLPGNKRVTEKYIKEKTGKTIDEFVNELNETKLKIKDVPGLKSFFRLKPPTKGFERKGIRKPYSMGGVFGYRGKEIKSLLEKMI